MANNLFSLFDDSLKTNRNLAAGEPQSLSTIASQPEEHQRILRKLQQFEVAESKVDYSDYANFVFFNSALDYFNITGEKILNEYPYDGTVLDIENFTQDLDGFQRYILNSWPQSTKGFLYFDPAVSPAYIKVNDSGRVNGSAQVGLLSPTTGSLSVELWCAVTGGLTGSDTMFLVQKTVSTGDGYTVYVSGSNVIMRVCSGSVSDEISVPFSSGKLAYFSFVLDRSDPNTPLLYSYSGSENSFPVLVNSSTSSLFGQFYVASASFYIGSGTLSGKTTRPLSGALDDIRIWTSARALSDLSSSYNVRVYSQDGLAGLWRFNESGSVSPDDGTNSIVYDSSGHKLDGRIQNYFSYLRQSGSLTPFDSPDLILSLNAPEVSSFVSDKQTSGSTYDRNNDNLITRLLPSQFFQLEEYKNTTVLQDFLYILARQFDFLKVKIDQFTNVLRTNYGSYNQSPDALLEDVGRFFGWEFTGNFLSADAFQYLLGKGVLQNQESNQELDVKLYQIKNEFWKRVLINLMYLYKTKGTRESVESLLRLYGVNDNFVRIKEYGYKPNVGISTFRILAEKTAYGLTFGSSSISYSDIEGLGAAASAGGFPLFFPGQSYPITGSTRDAYVESVNAFKSSFETIEVGLRFPTLTTSELQASELSGTIWTVRNNNNLIYQMYFDHPDVTSTTGSLYVTGVMGLLILSGVGIFDDRWYNVVFVRDHASSSYSIDVQHIDDREVTIHLTSSMTVSVVPTSSVTATFRLGSYGWHSEMWAQEPRVWSVNLDQSELMDHALNYQSYGVSNPADNTLLDLHWRFYDTGLTNDIGSFFPFEDISGKGNHGSGAGFMTDSSPFKKFLNQYNYIASPDMSWNEEKIRVLDGSTVTPDEAFADNNVMALEFNMIDALNEDISQIISTLDTFNEKIGLPANRYRSEYGDLGYLRKLYFARLQGRLNFRIFSDMLEFFDRSFVDIVKKLIPARTVFLGDQFVVESHMLERPKMQWNYQRHPAPFQPEGVISRPIKFSGDDVENILQVPSDKSDLSGVVLNRRRRHIGTIPDSVKGTDSGPVDQFGNPIFPGTGR